MAEVKKKIRVVRNEGDKRSESKDSSTRSSSRSYADKPKFSKDTRRTRTSNAPPAKMSRVEQRKVAKDTRLERRVHKDPIFEHINKAVALSEKSRKKTLSEDERSDTIDELWTITRPNLLAFLEKKQGPRIVKSLINAKNQLISDTIFSTVIENIVDLCKHLHASFIVKELYTSSKSQKKLEMLDALSGHFRDLLRHSSAAYVVDHLYNECPNALYRQRIVEELYGQKFSKLDVSTDIRSLSDIIKQNPAHRDDILSRLHNNISFAIGKEIFNVSPMLVAIKEYLINNYDAAATSDIVSQLAPAVHRFFDNSIGSSVACLVVGLSSPKDRKAILKAISGIEVPVYELLVTPALTPFFIKLIYSVDDTKAVGSVIIGERTDDSLATSKKYTGLANNVFDAMNDSSASLILSALFANVSKQELTEQQYKDIYCSDWASIRGIPASELAAAADNFAAAKAEWATRHPEINIESLYDAKRQMVADNDAFRSLMNNDKLKEDFEVLKTDPLPEVVVYPGRSKKDEAKRISEYVAQIKSAMEHSLDNLSAAQRKSAVQDRCFLTTLFRALPHLDAALKHLFFESLILEHGNECIFKSNCSWSTVKSFSKSPIGGEFVRFGFKHNPREFTQHRGALLTTSFIEYALENKIDVSKIVSDIYDNAVVDSKDKLQTLLFKVIRDSGLKQ